MTATVNKKVIVAAGPTGPTGTWKGVTIVPNFTGPTGVLPIWEVIPEDGVITSEVQTVYRATGPTGTFKTVIVSGFTGSSFLLGQDGAFLLGADGAYLMGN